MITIIAFIVWVVALLLDDTPPHEMDQQVVWKNPYHATMFVSGFVMIGSMVVEYWLK